MAKNKEVVRCVRQQTIATYDVYKCQLKNVQF